MADYPSTPFERAVDHAIAQENADPQGLPENVLAGMESRILAGPDTELKRLLTDPAYREQRLREGPR